MNDAVRLAFVSLVIYAVSFFYELCTKRDWGRLLDRCYYITTGMIIGVWVK